MTTDASLSLRDYVQHKKHCEMTDPFSLWTKEGARRTSHA